MKGKKTSVEHIIRVLREVEVMQGQGMSIEAACNKLSVSFQTFYKWRKEYGNLSLDKAKRLKELESENIRLKKLVADLSLDNAILNEVAEGTGAMDGGGSECSESGRREAGCVAQTSKPKEAA